MVESNQVKLETDQPYSDSSTNEVSNVIEIEGLLFPGFGPMRAFHGKQVFPVFSIK